MHADAGSGESQHGAHEIGKLSSVQSCPIWVLRGATFVSQTCGAVSTARARDGARDGRRPPDEADRPACSSLCGTMVGFDPVQPFARADERAAAQEPELDSVVALCENRAYEVGLACLRLSDFSIELCSFCDDAAYSRTLSVLASHNPRQILFPPSSAQSVLARVAEAEFPAARCDQVPRRNWNEIKGLGYVRHYSHRSHVQALETDVKSKYLALSALAALVDAVEQSDGASFVKGTLRIKCVRTPPAL